MGNHSYGFEGGIFLTKIGASWFVSYLFYLNIDNTHLNWQKVKTYKNRIIIFNQSNNYHYYWIEKILDMNNKKLNTNKINLTAYQIKNMAEKILDIYQK